MVSSPCARGDPCRALAGRVSLIGTIINAAAVVVAGTAGCLLGNRLPEKMRQTVMAGIGLTTLLIGAQMALRTQHLLIVLGSIVLGGIVGELIDLDRGLERIGSWLEAQVAKSPLGGVSSRGHAQGGGATSFMRAFVAGSLVFCVGPMTILAASQEGRSATTRL